jgi:hypothetical protein
MTDQVAEPTEEESQESEAADEAPEQEGTPTPDPEATWRKRLNGQTAATNKAIAERDELRQRLAAYEAKEREAQMADLSETERLKAEKADAERRAQEAEQKAEDKYLDRVYPNARKDFPEIRDEVRLAKLEAAFSESEPEETGSPRSMRAPKAAPNNKAPHEKTIAELEADLKTMQYPSAWGMKSPS